MGKKLSDIRKEIDAASPLFEKFLNKNLTPEIQAFIAALSEHTNVFIFSGIIRNFFLKINEIRDVDLVVSSDKIVPDLLSSYDFRRNSFGGYKISIGGINIDLWSLEKTWAFNLQTTLNYQLENVLHNTAFFNFSSVVYSMKDAKFFYSEDFVKFIKTKTLDVVFVPNANIGLCVVNTFYYSDKYRLKVSKKLAQVVKNFHAQIDNDYDSIQLKHFGKILYSGSEIANRVATLNISAS